MPTQLSITIFKCGLSLSSTFIGALFLHDSAVLHHSQPARRMAGIVHCTSTSTTNQRTFQWFAYINMLSTFDVTITWFIQLPTLYYLFSIFANVIA